MKKVDLKSFGSSKTFTEARDVDLQPARPDLPIQHRHRAEVGVRADAELALGGRAHLGHRRVAVDVERVRGMRGGAREEVRRQAQPARRSPAARRRAPACGRGAR